jgi:hypothetical protein
MSVYHKNNFLTIIIKMKNIYRGTAEHPFHLSVGAVLFNDKKEVACHYSEKFNQDTDLETAEDFYILMRETRSTDNRYK